MGPGALAAAQCTASAAKALMFIYSTIFASQLEL